MGELRQSRLGPMSWSWIPSWRLPPANPTAARTRYGLRPRAHARRTPDHQNNPNDEGSGGRDDRCANRPPTYFGRSVPHRYAARHGTARHRNHNAGGHPSQSQHGAHPRAIADQSIDRP